MKHLKTFEAMFDFLKKSKPTQPAKKEEVVPFKSTNPDHQLHQDGETFHFGISDFVKFVTFCKEKKIYDLILAVMRKDVPKILLKECQELAKNFECMNFIKLAQTWRELAIIHRKLKKEENIKPYTLQNIPIFNIDDKEYYI